MSKQELVKEQTLATETSLAELLSIMNMELLLNESEDENKNKMQNALEIFAKDLVPQKVDAIAYFVSKEDFALNADEQYIKDLKQVLDRRKLSFEKLKKYFASVLEANKHTSENRLNGIVNSIYCNYTFKQRPDVDINEIPRKYKKNLVTITVEEDVFNSIINTETPPPIIKMERQTVVNFEELKEDLAEQYKETIMSLEPGQEDEYPLIEKAIYEKYYNKNLHLKVSKSNRKGKDKE